MLRVDQIAKTFNKGLPNEKQALRGVSLELAQGDFAVVIGSNGAGKSTLLNLLAGDFVPDTGTIEIDGKPVTLEPAHRRSRHIGRVFQDPARGTAPGLTVEENLALTLRRGEGRRLRPAFSRKDRVRFADAIAPLGLGLEDRLSTQVDLLSGGQRQALSLIMAVMVTPRLLILDEHCAALDPRTAEAVMDATVNVVERDRITTLMVTHNMKHAIDTGSRLIMLHEGKVLFEAAGAEKSALSVEKLVQQFHIANDELLLSA